MIRQIENLPRNVAGFALSGKVTRSDHETIIFPAVKKLRKTSKELRIIWKLEESLIV